MVIMKKQGNRFNLKEIARRHVEAWGTRKPKLPIANAQMRNPNAGISTTNTRDVNSLFGQSAHADAPVTGDSSYDYSSRTTTQAPSGSPTMGFSQGLMEILKRANTSYAQAQDRLRAQRQGFDIQATNEANDFFNNPVLSANVATQMGNNAGEAYRPLTTGIEGQMAYNKDIIDTVNNQVEMYMDDYQKKLDRAQNGGFSLSEGEKRYDAQGNVIAEWDGGDGTGEGVTGDNKGVSLATNLLNSKGLKYATGTGLGRGLTRISPERVDFVNKTEQLIEYLTLNTFQDAKAKGATFGAMSNAEWEILRKTATEIGNAKIKTKNDRVVGYNMSEKAMKDWLSSLASGGQGYQDVGGQQGGTQSGQTSSGVGWSMSFNNAGNASVSIPQSSRLAYVNNNPGNLRFAKQSGAVPGQGGFARFQSPQHGYQALIKQIQLDASRGKSLGQFIAKYAPPTENDTRGYIANMVRMTGASPNTPLSQIDLNKLGRAIALQESSTRIA